MNRAINQKNKFVESEIRALAGRLESINPLAVLSRGYSLISKLDGAKRTLVTDAASLSKGDTIETRLEKGTVISTVVSTETELN